MKLNRTLKAKIENALKPKQVVILFGARRVGKTELIKAILSETSRATLLLNGEDIAVQEQFSRRSVANYSIFLKGIDLLVIDEAQAIPNVGQVLKLIVDSFDTLKVFVTGSSAFDLGNTVGEPLTGRKKTFLLFPFSEAELSTAESPFEKDDRLNQSLIYGNYPQLIHLESNQEKTTYLNEIVSAYLLKDILAFESLRNSDKILRLLKLIAFQIGSEVSYNELGRQLSMSKNTVERYLDLLSKVFVIHKLSGFSRNLRKEVSKSNKWYFYDNGIRNAILSDFRQIGLRQDKGALWENYLISERLKFQQYNAIFSNNYFWRTYDQQEIDLIEDYQGKLRAFEFKWQEKRRGKAPKAWSTAYKDANFKVISKANYTDWLSD